jgi:Flp pilus assembly protein TadG
MLRYIKRFKRDERGAIAIMFGLSLVPLTGLVAATIDYSRSSAIRSSVLAAADAAVLHGAKTTGTNDQRARAAEALFRANAGNLIQQANLTISFAPVMEGDREISYRATIEGSVPSSVGRVLGQYTIPIRVIAEAKSPRSETVDLAFVLDTTDSMQGARLATLKQATTSLLTELERDRSSPDAVRVSVVPFAQYVNIGMSNRTQPWLDVRDDYQEPVVRTCRMERPVVGTTNCRQVWVPPDPGAPAGTCMVDGVPRACGGRAPRAGFWRTQCDNVLGDPREVCRDSGGRWIRWNGCVGSRAFPLETADSNYHVKIPGIMDVSCGSPVLAPTTNLAAARTMVNGLTTNGLTYIPSGLIWGWRMLSTHEPFAGRASTPERPNSKYMILITDGANTRSASYPRHDGTNVADANSIMQRICTNMAADTVTGVRLYTIAFEIDDPSVKTLLRECSRQNNGQFYDAQNADQLVRSLSEIGRNMNRLRISR